MRAGQEHVLMRYRVGAMSREAAMPSSVQSWLGQELETRGIDAVVYTRYILSILQRDSLDLDYIDSYADDLPIRKEVKMKNKGKKKGRPRKSQVYSVDCEERKKTAAVECLLSVTDEDSGIEDLVEELCVKLRNLNSDKENSEKTGSTTKRTISKSVSPGDPTQKYYAAFPSLTSNNAVVEPARPIACQSPSVWDSRKLTAPEPTSEPPEQPQPDVKNMNPCLPATTRQQPQAHHYHGRRSKEKTLQKTGFSRQKDPAKPESVKKAHTEKAVQKQLKPRSVKNGSGSPCRVAKEKRSGNGMWEAKQHRVGRPKFIVPMAKVTNNSPPCLDSDVYEQQLVALRDSIERQLTEQTLSKINEPSAFSHFSKPFPKTRHSSRASVDDNEVESWYTQPMETLYCNSPVPSQPLYLRRPVSGSDVVGASGFADGSEVGSFSLELSEIPERVSGQESEDSTVLVSGILERYFNSDDDDIEDVAENQNVSFSLDYPVNHLGAPLLYNNDERDDTSNAVFPEKTLSVDPVKLLDILKDLKNELAPDQAADLNNRESMQGICNFPVTAEPSTDTKSSRFMSMFDSVGNHASVDHTELSSSAPQRDLLPIALNLISAKENSTLPHWKSSCGATSLWPVVFPTVLYEPLVSSLPSPFLSPYSFETCSLFPPFTMDWQSLLSEESVRHLWDVNLTTAWPEQSPVNLPGIFGTSPPAPQGLLQICDSLDYGSIHLLPQDQSPELPVSRGLWDNMHWGLAENLFENPCGIKTSVSTDSFFLQSNSQQNKTCKVKLLYRQRSWSFDDGISASTSVLSSVYSSPHTRACIDGIPQECLYETLLFSPETHFRPIQTPASCSPEEGRAVKLASSHVPDGYQKFNVDSDDTEFIPKFRLQKGLEKYAQTDDSSPDVNISPCLNQDMINVNIRECDQEEDPLQFVIDFDDDVLDPGESSLGTLAESLAHNAINSLIENESLDVESGSCDTDRAPSLSQSKFARLWKDPAPYVMKPSISEHSIGADAVSKESTVDDNANSVFLESRDTIVSDSVQLGSSCTQHCSLSLSHDAVSSDDGSTRKYSFKLENPVISALWKNEEMTAPTMRLSSPIGSVRRENSIWSVGSDSDAESAAPPLLLYEAAEVERPLYDMNDDIVDTDKDPLMDGQEARDMTAFYASELEKRWLQSEDSDPGQVVTRDTRESSLEPKKKVCAYFMEGHCKRSDCKFAHDLQHVTCRYWERGNCFKGITCPYLHGYHSVSSEVDKSTSNETSPEMATWQKTKLPTLSAVRSKLRKSRHSSPRRTMPPSCLTLKPVGRGDAQHHSNVGDIMAAKK